MPFWPFKKQSNPRTDVPMQSSVSRTMFDSTRPTDFMLALRTGGKLERLKSLIGAGADVNARDGKGMTPLMLASRVEYVEALIAAGADVNARDNEGGTALMAAVGEGSWTFIEVLIGAGADVNAKTQQHGFTALMCAALSSQESGEYCVKKLIAAGADVNAMDNEGWTALMRAAHAGHTDCVQALVAVDDLPNSVGEISAHVTKLAQEVRQLSNGPEQADEPKDPHAIMEVEAATRRLCENLCDLLLLTVGQPLLTESTHDLDLMALYLAKATPPLGKLQLTYGLDDPRIARLSTMFKLASLSFSLTTEAAAHDGTDQG